MANYKKKNKGIASLIFIWVLILLLAFGTFWIINYYTSNHSSIIENQELAQSIAALSDKNAGKLTSDDFLNIEEIQFIELDNLTYANFSAAGYSEAYEAYNKEGITEEEKAQLVNPSTLTTGLEISSKELIKYLPMFKNLKSLILTNYGAAVSDADVISIAADNLTNLTELALYGYTAENFSKVSNLTNLTSLSVAGAPIADISAVASLENLEILDLSSAALTDISALSSLDNEKIEMVYLTGNAITDWSPIEHLDAEKVYKEEPVVQEDTDNEEADNAEDETETEAEA